MVLAIQLLVVILTNGLRMWVCSVMSFKDVNTWNTDMFSHLIINQGLLMFWKKSQIRAALFERHWKHIVQKSELVQKCPDRLKSISQTWYFHYFHYWKSCGQFSIVFFCLSEKSNQTIEKMTENQFLSLTLSIDRTQIIVSFCRHNSVSLQYFLKHSGMSVNVCSQN